MIRILNIKGREGRFDEPSFIISENENLIIKVVLVDERRVNRFRLIVKHGNLQKTVTLAKNESVEFSPDWLKENAENLEFSLMYLNPSESAVIKDDYHIEPLKLQTLEGNFIFSAIVQDFEKRLSEQERRFKNLEKRVQEYETNGVTLTPEEDEEGE